MKLYHHRDEIFSMALELHKMLLFRTLAMCTLSTTTSIARSSIPVPQFDHQGVVPMLATFRFDNSRCVERHDRAQCGYQLSEFPVGSLQNQSRPPEHGNNPRISLSAKGREGHELAESLVLRAREEALRVFLRGSHSLDWYNREFWRTMECLSGCTVTQEYCTGY